MRVFPTLLAVMRRRPWGSLLLLLIALSLLAVGSSLAAKHIAVKQKLSAAELASRRYDFVAARQHLSQILVVQPNNARALLLSTQVARRLDDYAEAERILTTFESVHGVTRDSQLEWLLLTVQQGDLSDEKGILSAMDKSPHDVHLIREALAKGYMNTARWRDLLRLASRILQGEPDDVPAHFFRGRGILGLRQREAALEDYQRAVELAPEATWARLHLADMLAQLGHNQEAIDHYERLRQRLPKDADVLLGLARCHYDAADLEQSRRLLDELLAAHPDHVAGLVESGRLALQRRRLAEAESVLSRAMTLAPWHRDAHRYLIACLEEQGKMDAAQRCQQRLNELKTQDSELGRMNLRFLNAPFDPAANVETGKALLRNGQEEAGRHLFLSVLAFFPDYRPAHVALADYFAGAGQPRRAAYYRRLAEGGQP